VRFSVIGLSAVNSAAVNKRAVNFVTAIRNQHNISKFNKMKTLKTEMHRLQWPGQVKRIDTYLHITGKTSRYISDGHKSKEDMHRTELLSDRKKWRISIFGK